jgi:hypothetical protein
MITEPDVTLTDYGLALECAVFVRLLYKRVGRDHSVSLWLLLFFAFTCVAALTGGTVHGFFLDEATIGYRALWPTTLIATGATGLAAWVIGAKFQFSPGIARWICTAAGLEFAGYAIVVSFFAQTFFIAVINYLPAAIFLLTGLAAVYRKQRARQILVGIAGLLLTFVAAGIQQGGIVLHPVYFNHNALYHLIQAFALFMIFYSFRWLTTARLA